MEMKKKIEKLELRRKRKFSSSIKADSVPGFWGPKEKSSTARTPKRLYMYFDENTDKIDSYLTWF